MSGEGAVAPRCAGVVEERPPAVSRELERIGWVRRTFPAGGPDVLVWWACARPGAARAMPDAASGEHATDVKKLDPDDNKMYTLEQLQAKYKKQYSSKEIKDYWIGSCTVVELRIDPADGKTYSLDELHQHYRKRYKRWEVEDYFAKVCSPAAPAAQQKIPEILEPAKSKLPSGWPVGYPLPLLPPASLVSIEEVAEQSRKNQSRKALKASKLRQEWNSTKKLASGGYAKDTPVSASNKRWGRR